MGIFDRFRPADESRGRTYEGQQTRLSEDEQALARYRYMLKTAPPETIEQAHIEAFAGSHRSNARCCSISSAPKCLERMAHTPTRIRRRSHVLPPARKCASPARWSDCSPGFPPRLPALAG